MRNPLRRSRPKFAARDETLAERHRALGVNPESIVIAGDSLASMMPIADLFTPLHNRGQGGSTIQALRERLPEILEGQPARMMLLAGTNNLLRGDTEHTILREYGRLLDDAEQLSPSTELVILSIPPMRPVQDMIPPPSTIREINAHLARLARQRGHAYVDIHTPLCDDTGHLAEEWTRDGVHLTISAYVRLAPTLDPLFAVGAHANAAEAQPQ